MGDKLSKSYVSLYFFDNLARYKILVLVSFSLRTPPSLASPDVNEKLDAYLIFAFLYLFFP